MLWILSTAAALGLCVLAEMTARYVIRRRKHYAVFLPGLRLELHLDRAALPDLDPVIRFDINSDGERGAEVRRAERGLYRVLVAGGSAAEGYLLDQEANWPGVLERILNQDEALHRLGAPRVHVGSVARTSVASRDLDLILERVLPQYPRLDAVVIMVGASDVLKWLACGAPADAPAPPEPVTGLFACHPEGPYGWSPRRWALADLANRWRRRWLRPVEVRYGVGATLAQLRAMRTSAMETRTSVPDPALMLDNFETCFRQLLRRATASARHVLVVRQPWFEKEYTPEELSRFWDGALGQPWKTPATIYYSADLINRLMALVDCRAARVSEELDLEHVDLKALIEPSLSTYYDHWHFTPAGARLAAEAIAAALLRDVTQPSQPRRVLAGARDRTHTAQLQPARPDS